LTPEELQQIMSIFRTDMDKIDSGLTEIKRDIQGIATKIDIISEKTVRNASNIEHLEKELKEFKNDSACRLETIWKKIHENAGECSIHRREIEEDCNSYSDHVCGQLKVESRNWVLTGLITGVVSSAGIAGLLFKIFKE